MKLLLLVTLLLVVAYCSDFHLDYGASTVVRVKRRADVGRRAVDWRVRVLAVADASLVAAFSGRGEGEDMAFYLNAVLQDVDRIFRSEHNDL